MSTRPRFSTTARSTSGRSTSITCSTMTMVMPVPRRSRISCTPPCASAGVRPVSISSSSSTRGSVASARAISSRRFSGGVSEMAGTSMRAERPAVSITASARRMLSRAEAGAGEGAHHDVLQHRHGIEGAHHLEGAGHAGAGGRDGAEAGDAPPVEPDLAAVGRDLARDGVEQRRLAGAVGPDQPQDLAAAHVEGDVGIGLHAAEALRQVAHLEEFSHARLPGGRCRPRASARRTG